MVVRTTCRNCIFDCGVLAHVRNGNVVKVAGDPNHPITKGYICPKGVAITAIQNHPERLRYPLKRIGARGEGKWQRISWDETLTSIAETLLGIMGQHGPTSILVSGLIPRPNLPYYTLESALNTPGNFVHDVHICFKPQAIADLSTYGGVLTWAHALNHDLSNTNCVMIWGFNPTDTYPAFDSNALRVKNRGGKLIVVDPRSIPLVAKADVWLQVRPGSDGALALGMLNVIINEELYDKQFVRDWCVGFDQLKERVQQYDPITVAKITWVPKEKIVEAARIYAINKPAVLASCCGVLQAPNAVQTARALALLIAVTGNVDRKGSNGFADHSPILFAEDLHNLMRPAPEIFRKQLGAEEYPLMSGPESYLKMAGSHAALNAMLTGKPYPIKALLTNNNLLCAVEDSKRVLEALMKLDLLVFSDLFLTPTAEFADYVLPSTTYLETDAVSEYTRGIAARQKAVEPLAECRDQNEFVFDLLRKMSIDHPLHVKSHRELLDYGLKKVGITFEELKQKGYLVIPQTDKKYEKGLLQPGGKTGFNTTSGKCELYSSRFEKYGYDPLPFYKEPFESPYSSPELAKEFPLILITGTRSIEYYGIFGMIVPQLRRIHPDPLVEINPRTAEQLGITEGDWVWIKTQNKKGRVRRKAHLTVGIHPNVVNVEGLWWLPERKNQDERIWEANANVLTSLRDDCDPVCGGSYARCLLCEVSKT